MAGTCLVLIETNSILPTCYHRTSKAIVDCKKRVMSMLVGRSDDLGWDGVIDKASAILEQVGKQASKQASFHSESWDHRRGILGHCGWHLVQ